VSFTDLDLELGLFCRLAADALLGLLSLLPDPAPGLDANEELELGCFAIVGRDRFLEIQERLLGDIHPSIRHSLPSRQLSTTRFLSCCASTTSCRTTARFCSFVLWKSPVMLSMSSYPRLQSAMSVIGTADAPPVNPVASAVHKTMATSRIGRGRIGPSLSGWKRSL
jgi:hypothetical protein